MRLGKTDPALVTPMKIELKPDSVPVKVRARRYPPQQRSFLNKYVDELVRMGYFIPNPDASWQAAPHIVPKPNSRARYRMTIDTRPINAATVKKAWPMPHLDSEMQDFSGAVFFAVIDFVSGYWQLPLHGDSVDTCGVVCPNGVNSSTRVLQGLTNAAPHFQSIIEPLFSELRSNMKAWLDDFNLFAKTEDELLNLLNQFFKICKKHNLFLSAKKCSFFAEEIKWCGRLINKNGYRMDPSNAHMLKTMTTPVTAGELCEFVHCIRWMAISIPCFTEKVAPLSALLEKAYEKSGERTKRSIKNISLSELSWGTEHEVAFRDLQESINNAIELSHPDTEKVICIHTDASDRFWSGVVTQASPSELCKPHFDQQHQPMGFVGGEFTKSEVNWSTFEKEGFAIFKTFQKLDYLFLGSQDVHVFTDHKNLLYVFAPCALAPVTGNHVVSKVQRWALYLSRFNYNKEHIDGNKNIFADILTRWGRGHRSYRVKNPRVCSLLTMNEQLVPSANEIEWPSLECLLQSQKNATKTPSNGMKHHDGLIYINGLIWIPAEDSEMKLKILVASHCGSMDHRG